ncbi:MAG: long-chain fatty acid--CoA ligase [Firmicutes bacterium]|nr:long-chain fatty acid--CoA ligase [Bacillota bacterium]
MSRIALYGENSVGYVKSLLDIWRGHDSAVLIDPRIPVGSAILMMREANVKKCLIGGRIFASVGDDLPRDIARDIEFIPFNDTCTTAELLPDEVRDSFSPDYSSDEAVVIYSSGTTGKSKGIILSHFAANTNADAIIDYMKPTAGDRIYIAKTLCHSSTLIGELLVALKSHMGVIVSPTVIPPRFMSENINRLGATILCLNPTLLSLLTGEVNRTPHRFDTLRTIYVSGSILNEKLCDEARLALPDIEIYNVYGLSEAGPRVSAQHRECCHGASVGKAIRGVTVKIIGEDGGELPQGHVGMIHVCTPSIFSGYVVGEHMLNSLYMDWLNTGDIGFIDTYGELHVVGRADDVIITDSHKIYPSDIEARVLSIREVDECAVVGVSVSGKAYIGCLYVGDIDGARIKKILRACSPPYEVPKVMARCEAIPKNANGKVMRERVQEIIEDNIKEI